MEQNTNYYENPEPEMYRSPRPDAPFPKSSGLATASLVMGICCLVLICCGASFMLGALGIIFALLSRGNGQMNGSAKAGLILSIVGIILSIAVYAFYLISLFTSGQIQDMMDTYEYYYDFGEDDFNSDDVMDYYDSDGNLIFDEDQLNDLMQRSTPEGEL